MLGVVAEEMTAFDLMKLKRQGPVLVHRREAALRRELLVDVGLSKMGCRYNQFFCTAIHLCGNQPVTVHRSSTPG